MEKYVLDTNLFFNMEPGLNIGTKTNEVLALITKSIKNLKNKALFYMPPSIVKELESFFKDKDTSLLKEFLSEIVVKSPDTTKITLPAEFFYKIIKDVRERSYKGLLTSEKELTNAVLSLNGIRFKDKKETQIKIGKNIKNLRDKYRQNTRTGFLDSVADLDLIILAKEQDAYLVSTDEGVVNWGRIFGVKEIDPQIFGKKIICLE